MKEATQRLLELGLTEKEAHVYVSMLELGPASVQDISEKAVVNRTTTYSIIEELKTRGLVSSVTQGSRVVFTAESPKFLTAILEKEHLNLEERKKKMEEAMPIFMALYNSLQDKPRVRFFEGDDGVSAIREIMSDSLGEFLSFTAIDEDLLRIAHVNEQQRLRMAHRKHGKFVYALKPGCAFPEFDMSGWEIREIPYDKAPFKGEINIVDEKVGAYLNFPTSSIGFIVEGKELADLFRALFMAAWQSATPRKM